MYDEGITTTHNAKAKISGLLLIVLSSLKLNWLPIQSNPKIRNPLLVIFKISKIASSGFKKALVKIAIIKNRINRGNFVTSISLLKIQFVIKINGISQIVLPNFNVAATWADSLL